MANPHAMRLPLLSKLLFAVLVFYSTKCFCQYNYYYGNLHAHSIYSDGCQDGDTTNGKPIACYSFAKNTRYFDFLGISEHNHSEAGLKDWHNWKEGLEQASIANQDSSFVALYGMEFGLNEFGHVLVYGIDQLIGWEDSSFNIFCLKDDYNSLWKIIDSLGGIATLAHPKPSHFSSLSRSPYDTLADKAIFGTAIANGPSSSRSLNYQDFPKTSYFNYYKKLLSLGYRLGPTIDHDNHRITFGRTAASRTVVLAAALTRKDILDAYRSMRFYASEDWNAKVNFTIQQQPMGSELAIDGTPVIKVSVKDNDKKDKTGFIRLWYGRPGSGMLPVVLASSRNVNYLITRHKGIRKKQCYYYFAELRQEDGNRIVTAPIWVNRKS